MTAQGSSLILGSGSPRRREILTALRIPFTVHSSAVDEGLLPGEAKDDYLKRVVLDKLTRVTAVLPVNTDLPGEGAILVADTIVVLAGAVLGKPASVAEAESMLARLSGRDHEVCTRFALGRRVAGASCHLLHAETVRTRVTFRALEPEEIAGYARSGEGLDKAGAYAIQGLGAFAVARIEGSYTNVVGLPACELVVALRRFGLWEPFVP